MRLSVPSPVHPTKFGSDQLRTAKENKNVGRRVKKMMGHNVFLICKHARTHKKSAKVPKSLLRPRILTKFFVG